MIVNLCPSENVEDFSFIEWLQVFSLADGAVAARCVLSYRLVIFLLQTPPALAVENVDDLLGQRRGRWWDDPSGEAVYPEHGKHHAFATRQQSMTESDLWRCLERVDPDLGFSLLEFLHGSQCVIVKSASEVESKH